MPHFVIACVVLLLTASGAAAQPGPTAVSPFPRGLSGTLAFQSDARSAENPNARVRIYTLNLENGSIAAIGGGGDWSDEQPRWSPDGTRVAFVSNRGGSYNIYTMDPDGRNVVRHTSHAGNDRDPSWLPDGQGLVFSSDRDRGTGRSDLYRVRISDGAVERLTNFFEGYAFMPSVSPDGGWVAFVATTFPTADGFVNQVHVLELATRMTWPFDVTAAGCWPSWSPDGSKIAHVLLNSEPSTIQLISSFGDAPQPLPGEPGRWFYYPDWSPDNRLLAVSISPEHHQGEDWDLAIADPSRVLPLQRLTTGTGNDRVPDWKPR
jgi:Tol biopolymer transport system component